MRNIFRLRNLLIVAVIGGIIAVLVSRRSASAPPAYPDPWLAPTTAGATSSEAAEAIDNAAEAISNNGVVTQANDSEPAES